MKKSEIGRIVIEGVIGIALGIVSESIISGVKERNKKKNLNNASVADLTVAELREILREEA